MKEISNMKNLVTAYELIRKLRNMTPGVSPETLDGVSHKTLQNIQDRLKAGVYRFPPARYHIPKPGKIDTHPLTIASPKDKIVQKAILLVIEPLFEKFFLDCSHGFRPGKGTRTAIQYVDAKFQSCHYIIEADFYYVTFDSIQHEKLMKILKEKIICPKTLSLIYSELKAGYLEFGKLHENLAVGKLHIEPQGSILSPLLCNIYLHKLDEYMEGIKREHNIGVKRRKNKEYENISNAVKCMRSKGQNRTEPAKYKSLIKRLVSVPSMRFDESYVRVQYVRYADDFIIGIEGSYEVAKTILQKVKRWIDVELKLKLNPKKTGIVKYSVSPIKFLGYTIMAPHLRRAKKPLFSLKMAPIFRLKRGKIRIRFFMDYYKVLDKLKSNGFVKVRTRHNKHTEHGYRGTFRSNLINLEHADILRYYNSVIKGLYNYYNFVGNMSNLAHVLWLLTESCCLTLARKFKLRTMAATYRKFGKDLGCDINLKGGKKKRISIFKPTVTLAK
jgi:group II intron reverse transcriptase/maturase